MAKKKKTQTVVTPEMQNEFNRYSQVFGNVEPSTFGVSQPLSGSMTREEILKAYNTPSPLKSSMTRDEILNVYNQSEIPTLNKQPSLADLQTNPVSEKDLFNVDYSRAISDIQNRTPEPNETEGVKKSYDDFFQGLLGLQSEVDRRNNAVRQYQQPKVPQNNSTKGVQKDTTTRTEDVIREAQRQAIIETQKRMAKESANLPENATLSKKGYHLRPNELRVENEADKRIELPIKKLGKVETESGVSENEKTYNLNGENLILGTLKKTPTLDLKPKTDNSDILELYPSLTQVARNNVNPTPQEQIAKDKEKIKADRAIRVAEGDYSEAISHYNELANKKDLTKEEKKEIDEEFKRLGNKYGVGKTSDISIQKYRDAVKNGEISEEYANAVSDAHYRHSAEGKALIGLGNFGATLMRPFTTALGLTSQEIRNANADVQKQLDEWQEDAPVASTIGDMAGMLSLYSGVNALPEAVSNIGGRIAINQGIDNVLDVIPRLKTNYDAGKYNNADGTLNEKALLTDIALQEGMSAVGNGIGEGINALSNRALKNSAIRNFDVNDILENSSAEELGLDMIPRVNDVAKDAVETLNDAVKNSENITPNNVNLRYNVNEGEIINGQNEIINTNDGRTSEGILREVRTDGGMGETGLANGVAGREYLPSNRQAVADVLITKPKVFDQETTDFFAQNKIPFSEYYDTDDADLFVRALETAKANNPHGQSVDSHSVEEIQEILRSGGKTFLTADGTAGGAVDNGNLTAVFKDNLNNNTPRQGSMIGLAGVKNGAVKGDCFGEFLVNTYSRSGFEPVARMKYGRDFNKAMDAQVDQLIKEGILTEEPDVYVLKLRDGYDYKSCVQNYNTAKRYTKSELDALPEFTDYDEMLQYRDSLIKQPQREGAFFDTPTEEVNIPKVDNATPQNNGATNNLNNLDNERPLVTPEQVAENVTKDLPPETAKSNFAKTAKKVGYVSQEELEKDKEVKAIFEHARKHEEGSINTATERIAKDAEYWENSYLNGTKINTDEDVDTAMSLISNIKMQEKMALEAGDEELANSLKARRTALLNRTRQDLTEHGQTVQALAKWARTADGAELNATQIKNNVTKNWKNRNLKTNKNIKEYSNRLLKALENFGNDGTIENAVAKKPTHAQVVERVKNTFGTELGSIDTQFAEKDYDYFAKLLENNAPEWKLRQEIGNVLKNGEVSGEMRFDENQKVKSIIDKLVNGEKPSTPKTELGIEDIKRQIRNTLNSENKFGEIGEQFSDEDIDYLANLIHYGAKQTDIENAIATKMATGSFAFNSDTIRQVNEIFDKAQGLDINSRARYLEEVKAYKLLADEIGAKSSFADKFNAWRYLAMLGNPKTHLRNIFGNLSFQIITGMSNNLASVMESATDFATKKSGGIERRKAIINWAKKEDRALFDGAWKDAVEKSYRQLSGNKYGDSIRSDIRNQMSVFDSKGMRAINDLNSSALDTEDFAFMRNKYATSMTGYLKANGLDSSVFDAEKRLTDLKLDPLNNADEIANLQGQVKKLSDAREYAIKQAEYSAFHEDNEVAKILSDLSRKAQDSNSPLVNILGKTLIEGQVPFKKTPANILKSGLEYSPLNIVQDAILAIKKAKGIGKDVNILKVGRLTDDAIKNGGEVLASDLIESMSKTLTGSGLLVLGSWMYHKGFLNSSKEPEKWQDELEGKQNYSISIPMPDGKTFTATIDSFAPSVMPLLVGAEFAKIMENNGVTDADVISKIKALGTDFDGVLNSLYSIADPLLETSMMSGVNDTLESVSRAISNQNEDSKNSAIGALVANTATGYATQGIPTLLGQISRSIDPIRRSTYTDQEGTAGVIDKQIKKVVNKTPLSVFNEPYVNARGQMEYNSPIGANDNPIDFLGNMAYQMFSPSYIDEYAPTEADTMARNVYNNMSEPDAKVYQDLPTSKKINKERVSEEDYTTYATETGKVGNAIRSALARNEEFNNLPADNQAEILKQIDTLGDKVGEAKINPDFNSTNKAYNAYVGNPNERENGQDKINRVVDFFINEQKADIQESEMQEKGLPTSDFVKELYNNPDTEQKTLDNVSKADAIVKEIYGDDKEITKSDFAKYENTTQFRNYLKNKKALEDAGLSATKDNLELIKTGGIDAVKEEANHQQEIETLQENWKPYGIEYSDSIDEVYNRVKKSYNISDEEFAKTYKKIDPKQDGVSQTETIAYLNSAHITSQSEGKKLWNAYYGDGGSYIPVLEDGKWKKKKKNK